MLLRLQNTKIHKGQTINTLDLVHSLSLRVFVAKMTFRSGLNLISLKFIEASD